MLQDKIKTAIEFLQKAEKLALMMQPEHGFWLCYSGGKDSDVILELAKMAGVKFTAYYNVTTIDPPELVRYVIEKHPEVKRLHPVETFLQILKRKKMLPTRRRRFCCAELKEKTAAGYCAITGVRAAESQRRKRQAAKIKVQNQKGTEKKDFEEMQRQEFQCIDGKDKIIINPIIDWTEKDVWEFIKFRQIDYCSLYDQGFKRLGCLFCPMAAKRERERERIKYSGFYNNIVKAVKTFFDKNKNFKTPEDMVSWWFSNLSIKKWKAENYQQLKINFDFENTL